MQPFQSEIDKIISGKKDPTPEDSFVNLIHLFLKEYRLSIKEILDMPVPLTFKLIEKIKEQQDLAEKEIEKSKNKNGRL